MPAFPPGVNLHRGSLLRVSASLSEFPSVRLGLVRMWWNLVRDSGG